MRKLLFILAIFFAFGAYNNIDAQNSFGVAVEYQSKKTGDPWGTWMEASKPVLIYIDLGFGFIAIENGYKDRFIINSLDPLATSPEKTAYIMKCVDKNKKECTIKVVHFQSGNTALEISYNDIEYAYLVNSDFDAAGYPNKYFENKEEGGSKLNSTTI